MENRITRDVWVDNVKVVACILVALGHFFQSMQKSCIIQGDSLLTWFNATIYTFHVPLFFICSGYLYQKYSVINTFSLWKANIYKKLLTLGVPYLFFSSITWTLKHFFSADVNEQVGSLFYTLLLNPLSPYWFLYILLIVFVITPTIKSRKTAVILLGLAVLLVVFRKFGFHTGVYAVDKTALFWCWFIIGMMFAKEYIPIVNRVASVFIFGIFIALSIMTHKGVMDYCCDELVVGLMACYSIICFMISFYADGKQNKIWGYMAQYTMPVFLMHTLFAAPLRSGLIKLGITNFFVHFISGIIITFCGPVLAFIVMEHLKPLDYLIYPGRYIKKSND